MERKYEGNTKERILEEAIKLFKEYGYDNVTVMQICDAAKITKRTFYYHYRSKEQLIIGVTDLIGVEAEKSLHLRHVEPADERRDPLGDHAHLRRKRRERGPRSHHAGIYKRVQTGKGEELSQSTYMFDTGCTDHRKGKEFRRDLPIRPAPATWPLRSTMPCAAYLSHGRRKTGISTLKAIILQALNTILGTNYTPEK